MYRMAHTDQLEEVADQLGYLGTSGYVDGTELEVGARDFVWRDLKYKCRIDAAYFRGAVPLVAFVGTESHEEINRAHRRLWNFGRVPVLIASTPQEVVALSCVVPPPLGRDANSPILRSARPQQSLRRVLEEFTRFNVESGRAASEHRDRFDRRMRVDYRLLENLRRLHSRLIKRDLGGADVEQLLGRSIFIRYLEDRRILSEEHLLELGSFRSFADTLRAGPAAVTLLFNALAEHFNGDVFRPTATEAHLPAQAIADLDEFFSAADLESGQQALWPYDFGIIPPELISSIYEQLLADTQKEDSAYYTPRPVVDLVLDELLPWPGVTAQPSILDPSCGSGIFLAEAFRRLAYRHITAAGQPPTFDRLTTLLSTSIYGVDKKQAAIGVSAFSLYLALLEHVDPRTAWREARLPVLVGRNLIVSDFFDDHALAHRHFDLIIGNPPWKSALSPAAAAYVRREHIKLPDNQIAHAFLWRAAELTTEGGAAGLVLPAKSLLHNRSAPAETARRHIFNDLNVETVVDLSPIRRQTFGAAKQPAAVVIIRHRGDHELMGTVYVSPRRTPLAEAIDGIVVSQENIRHLPQALTGTTTAVWKANLWGTPVDFELITRLRETFPSLETVAQKNGWQPGQGFQVKGGDQNDAREIVGMTLLETESVGPMRLLYPPSKVVTDAFMHRPRVKQMQIYRAPHVIMRNGFNDYPVSVFLDFDAAFTDGLFGLGGRERDTRELQVISGLLNSSVARYWFFMTSTYWGVEREQIKLAEYLSLPIPPAPEKIHQDILSAVRLAASAELDEAEWMGILDAAVFRAYGFTPDEENLVRDGLGVRLDEYRKGPESVAYEPPKPQELDTYVRILASHVNATESIQWAVGLIERSGGFAVVACRATGTSASEEIAPFSLDRLLAAAAPSFDTWESPAAVLQPSAIVVEGTNVYLVKPNQRRSWTRSTAQADAAEVLGAILMAPATGEI